ncbi:MAG: carboxy-S-adenosyl-L-methionine synthase CmoA [Sulfurovaceae bacterium]|nr:carboxy-S-adenosyl-L-methionine synthase CmoA [Sulfurovaceae bacterium]MDD5549098.1 carboxy-S-adenosyl-L-methionine synthase CmoA [Sulfurovaceae bacterium]
MNNNKKDNVFEKAKDKKFEFDESVATVFDDMLSRSIPFYDEVQKLIISFILENQKDGKKVLDLGSSTAKFLIDLHSRMNTKMHLKGLDNSEAMLKQAMAKCKAYDAEIELILADLITYNFDKQDFITSNYTLQFIRPIQRASLVKKIYNSLQSGGYFIFSEKVVFEEKKMDKIMIDIYYNFKKAQGYSTYEISNKREALENVLVPYTIEENIKLCSEAGFENVTTIFQWANFVTFVAQKK